MYSSMKNHYGAKVSVVLHACLEVSAIVSCFLLGILYYLAYSFGICTFLGNWGYMGALVFSAVICIINMVVRISYYMYMSQIYDLRNMFKDCNPNTLNNVDWITTNEITDMTNMFPKGAAVK